MGCRFVWADVIQVGSAAQRCARGPTLLKVKLKIIPLIGGFFGSRRFIPVSQLFI
jgi:hypothetical protein